MVDTFSDCRYLSKGHTKYLFCFSRTTLISILIFFHPKRFPLNKNMYLFTYSFMCLFDLRIFHSHATTRCTGRLHTVDDNVVKVTVHTHAPDARDSPVKTAMAGMREKAKNTIEPTRNIVDHVLGNAKGAALRQWRWRYQKFPLYHELFAEFATVNVKHQSCRRL